MHTAIKVENLGKKYIITHNKENEYTFRGAMTQQVRRIFQPDKFRNEKTEEFWALKD